MQENMRELTENHIMLNWNRSASPLVSVRCITYNHAPYIACALESFLMQETNFPFEIVVHDDASTDETADIIRTYESRFPHIIKAIYETENQYSKNDGSLKRIIDSECCGKYFAFCEGDDYWIDCKKLQKQVDFLESHQEYVACAHNTLFIELNNRKKDHLMFSQKDAVLTIDNLAERYHASSLMCRSCEYLDIPLFFSCSLAPGDVKLAAYLKFKGPIFRSGEVMSAYRRGVLGSWSKTNADCKRNVANRLNVISFYEEFDEWTDHKYESVSHRIDWLKFNLLLKQGFFFKAKQKYPGLFKKMSLHEKLYYFLKKIFRR